MDAKVPMSSRNDIIIKKEKVKKINHKNLGHHLHNKGRFLKGLLLKTSLCTKSSLKNTCHFIVIKFNCKLLLI